MFYLAYVTKQLVLFSIHGYILTISALISLGNISLMNLKILLRSIFLDERSGDHVCILLQPVQEFDSFKVDERPGEQWIRLSRKFGENEEIKVEVTMFDHSIPVGDVAKGEDVQLHITMIVDVFKGEGSNVLEFVCSAWPDSIEIQKVFTRGHERMAGHPYLGPGFKYVPLFFFILFAFCVQNT